MCFNPLFTASNRRFVCSPSPVVAKWKASQSTLFTSKNSCSILRKWLVTFYLVYLVLKQPPSRHCGIMPLSLSLFFLQWLQPSQEADCRVLLGEYRVATRSCLAQPCQESANPLIMSGDADIWWRSLSAGARFRLCRWEEMGWGGVAVKGR